MEERQVVYQGGSGTSRRKGSEAGLRVVVLVRRFAEMLFAAVTA